MIPASEQEFSRQRELDTYRIVDSLPEEAYEDIVRLASLVCGAPTALISFIDRDRQWFKARTGFDCAQSARDEAFCDHAIRTPDRLMEVPDARLDARFEELAKDVAKGTSAYDLAAPFMAHAVIDPRETRDYLARQLDIFGRRLTGGVGAHRLADWPPAF